MTSSVEILTSHSNKILFLVWGTSDQGPRSRVMANKLGIAIRFINTNMRREFWTVPFRYALQSAQTILTLFKLKPRLVFVQNPPMLAVFIVNLYCMLAKGGFIIDAHSEAFLAEGWTAPPSWLKRFLARHAVATIVTNDHLKQMVEHWGGNAVIIRDVPTLFASSKNYQVSEHFNIALINTFAADEPLDQVIGAARRLPQAQFYITGKITARSKEIVAAAPANVLFTGFLPDETYYALLSSVDSVMCLTKRDHTMQRGACEALSLGKPIITSKWDVLRDYFYKGTIHVDNSMDDIQLGVEKMMDHFPDYSKGILELQLDQQREWEQKITDLVSLIQDRKLLKD